MNGPISSTTTTDEHGRYEFSDLDAGDYKIQLSKPPTPAAERMRTVLAPTRGMLLRLEFIDSMGNVLEDRGNVGSDIVVINERAWVGSGYSARVWSGNVDVTADCLASGVLSIQTSSNVTPWELTQFSASEDSSTDSSFGVDGGFNYRSHFLGPWRAAKRC